MVKSMVRGVSEYEEEDWLLDDDGLEEDDEQDRRPGAVAGLGAWGVSICIHAVVIALMGLIVFYSAMKEDQAPLQVMAIEPPPEQEEEKERELVETEVVIDSEVTVDNAVVHELELPVEEIETEDEVVADVPIKGRSEADAVAEVGGPGAFMAIGAGGGASGAFGNRQGGGRKRAVGRFGGTKASESAVEAALRWFMRHQSPNGMWDVDGYPLNCQEPGPKCEPGTKSTNISGDVACTGYAVLCFLGAGYDHRSANRYRHVVRKGLDWLLATQQDNGLLGIRNYEHPVAVMALAEAYAMTNDQNLRDPVQRGVNLILERQLKYETTTLVTEQEIGAYGLGWNYIEPKVDRIDSSVSGWNVMALKAAMAGGIDVGTGMDGAKDWLLGAWEARNGEKIKTLDNYGESHFLYVWNPSSRKHQEKGKGQTSIGLLCAVFLGHQQGDLLLDTMANYCFNHMTPQAWPTDTYYMYYNTLGMFQVGGEKWQQWNKQVRDLLVDNQRKDPACFDGSWDPQGMPGHGLERVGRLLITAYCCLSLEVYYRYVRLKK